MKAWYRKYDKLSSALFNYENSGKRSNEAPPWKEIRDDNFDTIDVKGFYGMQHVWGILGYTENPPFPAEGYPAIAIMFEDQKTFEKRWWHFSKD